MSLTDSFKVGGAVLVIGIAVAFYHSGNTIARLEQQLQTQSTQLQSQQQAYAALEKNLDIERQATHDQKAINDEIRQKQEKNQREIHHIIQSQPCARVDLPRNALERLRKP